jgi:penicillin-binding protein 1A
MGRDDNKPLPGVAGGGLPAHVWQTFMSDAIGARPAKAKLPRSVDPDDGLGGVIDSVFDRLRHVFHF